MNTKFTFSKMTEPDARAVLAWRYEAPYDFYDRDPHFFDRDVATLIEPTNLYLSVRDGEGELIAYYCFGSEAQIEGGDYIETALDTMGQARPNILGSGFGEMFIRVAMDFGTMFFHPRRFRATVPAFNTRAIKLCEKAGFTSVTTFTRSDGVNFVVLTKVAEREDLESKE